jgi:hypothetical protein
MPGDKEVICNKFVLGEVVKDMKRTTLPTWISPPPQNLGAKKNGKLSADHWRTACTVSLVITLVRLWSSDTGDLDAGKRLENFMALVGAVRYTMKRTTSEKSIAIYEEEMRRYLDSLVELFGIAVVVPNHHLSLHLPDFLRRLGPVHGWWTFAFERYNGIIQRLNTNSKIGM